MNRCLMSLLFLFPCGLVISQSVMEVIEDTDWIGQGTLMGNDATFEIKWTSELGGQFTKLEFENSFIGQSGIRQTMKAHAYYQDEGEGKWSGTWFDSRGISFPLSGISTDDRFVVVWGSAETEQGRTTYRLTDTDQLVVIDEILSGAEYRKFGSASYEKVIH